MFCGLTAVLFHFLGTCEPFLCCWQLTVQNNVLLPLSRTCHKNVTRTLPVVLLISSRELFISLINNRRFLESLICHERLHLPSETTVQETSSFKCIIDTEQADKLIKWESSLFISVPVWVRVGFLGRQWVIPHEGRENALRRVHRLYPTISQ
jgi:hypothetical protein